MNNQIEQLFTRIGGQFVDYLPSLLGGLLLIAIGLVLGWLVKRIIIKISVVLRVDRMFRRFRWGAGFSKADKYFESAVNLRPDILRDVLLSCTQVKAKRLFMWFTDRHRHAWRERFATEGIDLGRGKRMIVKGGTYDANYQITVPREMNGGSESPLY